MGALADAPLRTVVVGGGPGGLFYALLAKQRMPAHEVVVIERNPPDATFGFGVVFSERTLGGFGAAEPSLQSAMVSAGVAWDDIEVRRGDRRLRCGGHGFSAIARKTLLRLIQERAAELGVTLRFGHEATEHDLAGADLVVAADGVNSQTRDRHADAFAPKFETGAARFIWFATPQSFDALTFLFVTGEHGHWGVHAYPFDQGTSTFIVETDEGTWRRAGLDGVDELAPGVSDMESLRFCETLFAEHLGGHGLLENNSKWQRFRTLRCASWRHGNVALVGDAAHTAHFSVGSGTKMAMEDAVALVDAVAAGDDMAGALKQYETVRRPAVERIQNASIPSLIWWERFRHLATWPDEEFVFHFLTRSPIVTRSRLKARDFRFVRGLERWHARQTGGTVSDGPLAAPFRLGPLRLPTRLVVAPSDDVEPLVALGGPALGGAGLLLAPSVDEGREAAAWVRAHTEAAVGVQLGNDANATDAERGASAGYDVLAVPATAEAARHWPRDRPLLAIVDTPADPEGPDGDVMLAELRAIVDGRIALVGVAARPDTGARAIVAQLLLCDRIRQEMGRPTVLIDGAPDGDAAATAVLAGRTDLVQGMPSLASERWVLGRRPASVRAGASAAQP